MKVSFRQTTVRVILEVEGDGWRNMDILCPHEAMALASVMRDSRSQSSKLVECELCGLSKDRLMAIGSLIWDGVIYITVVRLKPYPISLWMELELDKARDMADSIASAADECITNLVIDSLEG